jgi:hypothetical protein
VHLTTLFYRSKPQIQVFLCFWNRVPDLSLPMCARPFPFGIRRYDGCLNLALLVPKYRKMKN